MLLCESIVGGADYRKFTAEVHPCSSQHNFSEDTEYQILRKLAMDRNRSIGEVASEIIVAAEVLI